MSQENHGGIVLSRRGLLTIAVTSIGGVAFSWLSENCAEAQVNQTVSQWMGIYARETGFANSGQSIDEYKRALATAQAKDIDDGKKKMVGFGFSDFSPSVMTQADESLFYHLARHTDNFNGCAAFYDGNRTSRRGMVEGPSLVALSVIAKLLKQEKSFSTDAARRMVYPKQAPINSMGTFQTDVERHDNFVTRGGIVSVRYKSTKKDPVKKTGEGIISVTAVQDRSKDRKVVLDKDLNISYQYV